MWQVRRVSTATLFSIVFSVLALGPLAAHSATIYVGPGEAYKTIQAGVSAAVDGDMVIVRDGTYSSEGVGIVIYKSITVTSQNGPEKCIIDGTGSGGNAFLVVGAGSEVESVFVRLSGFTIRNLGVGFASADFEPYLTISNCTISGGVGGYGTYLTITDSTISNNAGGGVDCTGCPSVEITRCTISGNRNDGVYCDYTTANTTITDSTISGNGNRGIMCGSSSPTITNCTVSDNGWHGITCYSNYYSSPTITDCTVSGNGHAGIECYGADTSPKITNCTISNNNFGILYTGSSTIDATLNDWGDPSGPLDDSDDRTTNGLYNPTGKGNKVSDRVNYYPWKNTTIGTTATPTGLAGIPDDGAISLTWNANSESFLGGYKIYHRTASETRYRAPIVVGNETSYRLTGLTNETTYHIAISSMNSVGVESTNSIVMTVIPRPPYIITAGAGIGGTISPSGSVSVGHGTDQPFTITPGEGYHVLEVLVDGVSVGAVTTYTFSEVTRAHTIEARFAINTNTITAEAGLHGAIAPSGAVKVQHNAEKLFKITPDTGYHVKDVLVDGQSKGAVETYTFIGVTADHTISASFESNVRIVTDVGSVVVPEGKSAGIQVKLSEQPASNVVVSVSWLSGDPDIGVLAGSSVTFTPSNWNSYRPVTLAAVPDGDLLNGSANMRLSADWLAPTDITATEKDEAQCTTVLTISDINGNGFSELAVLQRNVVKDANSIYVKDSKTGALIKRLSFAATGVPKGMAAIDDHGACNLALLAQDKVTGEARAELRSPLKGNLVNTVSFGKAYAPMRLVAVPDLNGNGAPELAMLGVHKANGKVGVQVRDGQSGSLLKTVFFSQAYTPQALAVVPDVSANGKSGLAVLGVNAATHKVKVEIRDAGGGALIRAVPFLKAYRPQNLAVVPDIDGRSTPGIAVLGVDAGTGKVMVQVKNVKTGSLVRNTQYNRAYSPRSLATVPDTDLNPGSELALLGARESLDDAIAEIRDAITGSLVKNVPFASAGVPQALTVLPDTSQDGNPDLAALGTNKSSGKVMIEIRDVLTGSWVRNISIP